MSRKAVAGTTLVTFALIISSISAGSMGSLAEKNGNPSELDNSTPMNMDRKIEDNPAEDKPDNPEKDNSMDTNRERMTLQNIREEKSKTAEKENSPNQEMDRSPKDNSMHNKLARSKVDDSVDLETNGSESSAPLEPDNSALDISSRQRADRSKMDNSPQVGMDSSAGSTIEKTTRMYPRKCYNKRGIAVPTDEYCLESVAYSESDLLDSYCGNPFSDKKNTGKLNGTPFFLNIVELKDLLFVECICSETLCNGNGTFAECITKSIENDWYEDHVKNATIVDSAFNCTIGKTIKEILDDKEERERLAATEATVTVKSNTATTSTYETLWFSCLLAIFAAKLGVL